MNKDKPEIDWKQMLHQATTGWSIMSDEDLLKVHKAGVKLDQDPPMLRVKYGYTNEQAKKISANVWQRLNSNKRAM